MKHINYYFNNLEGAMKLGRNLQAKILSQIFTAWVISCSCMMHVHADPVEVKPPQQKILASQNGRFVFGQISDFRRDQFMLDTQTGRLWVVTLRPLEKHTDGTQPSGEGIKFLEPVPYADGDGNLFGKNNNWNFTAPNN